MMTAPKIPLISNIQRFSVDDGPGIRTTIFMKGCNLHCFWCHNPENISFKAAIQFRAAGCVTCGRCQGACAQGVHHMEDEGHAIDRSRCLLCGNCAEACFCECLELIGKPYRPEEVLEIVKKDVSFYSSSGGGVTFSGGEPMLFPGYLAQCLGLCRHEDMDTAVDTAGNVPFSHFEQILELVDLFLYDVKCFDGELHKTGTGVDNTRIKDNLVRLSDLGARIIIRVPIIPGFNDNKEELARIADFIETLPRPVELVQLLPYHAYAQGKYEGLGIESPMTQELPPSPQFMQEALALFEPKGCPARIS